MRRANTCLALYYQADDDADTKLAIRQAFVRALDAFPAWAMHAAFDAWERTMQRRPSPGEIVILAERALAPLVRELNFRKPPEPEPPRATPSPEEAERIIAAAGFTPARMAAVKAAPMATTFSEAERHAAEPKQPHWSEVADPLGPEWAALRASRAKNALIHPK